MKDRKYRMKDRKYIDLLDSAELLKVHPESLRLWIREGRIQPADPTPPYDFKRETIKAFHPRSVGRPKGSKKSVPERS